MLTLNAAQRKTADTLKASAISFGWSLAQACGILSAAMAETSMGMNWRTRKEDIHVVGDDGRAHGLFQIWDVAGVKRGCGVDIKTASIEDQLRAVDWMLRHGDPADRHAGVMLIAARTPADAARALIAFERPKDREKAARERIPYAEDFYAMYGPSQSAHVS